jgi:hypothetical protein
MEQHERNDAWVAHTVAQRVADRIRYVPTDERFFVWSWPNAGMPAVWIYVTRGARGGPSRS